MLNARGISSVSFITSIAALSPSKRLCKNTYNMRYNHVYICEQIEPVYAKITGTRQVAVKGDDLFDKLEPIRRKFYETHYVPRSTQKKPHNLRILAS